jgi:parvulin-like peptidyl-prolyl isomerase
MGDKQLINILKRFMSSFSSLNFNTKDIKKYIDGFTDEELKNIAESILRATIERNSYAMLPTKESIMTFLRYVKPLENKEKNKQFKQKIGLWVNLSDMAFINGDTNTKNMLRKIYGDLNTDIRKIAQAVDAGFIRSLFDANPELNIDPDKDVPDWRIIFQGDFLGSLNKGKETFINTNNIPNKIDDSAKALLESMKISEFGKALDQAEKAVESLKEKINALGGGAIANASKTVQKFFNTGKDTAIKTLDSVKNFRDALKNAKSDEERAKIVIQASNSLAMASFQAAKTGISSFKNNIEKLGKQIQKGITSDNAKKIMIGAIDGMINEAKTQIENENKRIEGLKELISKATGNSISVDILLDRSENAKSNDREQQEAERILKATDYITKGQIESYKIQINAGIRGIEILESFIKNLEEVKNDVATITPETVTKVTGILYSKVRGIYDGIVEKVKAIEEAYDKQIEAIEQKQQKLEGKK